MLAANALSSATRITRHRTSEAGTAMRAPVPALRDFGDAHTLAPRMVAPPSGIPRIHQSETS